MTSRQTPQTGIDRYYLFVLVSIVIFGVISLSGYIFLLATSSKPAEQLLNVAFACAGAIFGAVMKPTTGNPQSSSEDIISQIGAKAALQLMQDSIRASKEAGEQGGTV